MWRAMFAVSAIILSSALRPVLAQDDQNVAREQLNAVVWVQNATEYAASTRSVYSAAGAHLSQLRRKKTSASVEQMASGESMRRKDNVIVVDIDETILDNSAYNCGPQKLDRGLGAGQLV